MVSNQIFHIPNFLVAINWGVYPISERTLLTFCFYATKSGSQAANEGISPGEKHLILEILTASTN